VAADGGALWARVGDRVHHLPDGAAFPAAGAYSLAAVADGVALGRRGGIDVRPS
jgi:hypothetical protein